MSQRTPTPIRPQVRSEDQGYLASVSDLMSVLLFIFIITLMLFVINLQETTISARETQDELEEQIITIQTIQKELTDARQVRQELMEDIARSLLSKGVKVRIDTDRGILHVPEDILFPSGQAEFMAQGHQSLQILGTTLAEKLPCYSGSKQDAPPASCGNNNFFPGRLEAVLIEGHTDNIPMHSARYADNWQLSTARSLVTFRYLMQQQPALAQLINAQKEPFFGVSAYGETRPTQVNETDDGRRANRRIDLRFILAPPESLSGSGA